MFLLVAAGVFVIGILGAAAAWRDLLAARAHLVSARTTLEQVVSHQSTLNTVAGRAATTQQLQYATDDVSIARQIIRASFPLKVASFLPIASSQRSGLLRLDNDSSTALAAGTNLVNQANQMVAQGKINGAQVPLGSLAPFETNLRSAGTTIAGLNRRSGGLLGPLASARNQFDTLAASTSARLLSD